MTIQITIIGLGQVGASLGLALAEHKDKIYRRGHDPEPTRMKKMEKEGVVDKTFFNLPESVRDADVVILALPVDQVQETLKYISEDLKSGAVVVDTSTVRLGVLEYAKKLLPADRHFVSMYPVVNAVYLDQKTEDRLIPHADLFKNSEMIVATETATHPDAVKLAADLAELVGSKAYFTDPTEADGISARIETLPKLAAAGLLHATYGQSGWKDARRFTSAAFLKTTAAIDLLDEKDTLGESAILNSENTVMAINQMIEGLLTVRDLIENKDQDGLKRLMKGLKEGRDTWMDQRKTSDWEKYAGDKPPSTKDILGGLFGIRPKKKKTD
jgi:prephenate dehydrogenase